MKPAPFAYTRPQTLAEATALLSRDDCVSMAISGGQSLLVLMGLRFTMADSLIDITRIPEIGRVEETANTVFIGATTTHAAIEDGKVPDPSAGLMPRVAAKIAYRAIRNMGTIGGSMALADSSADWPACLMALDADVVISGRSGERREKATSFITGPYQTTLMPGELIVGFDIPKLKTAKWGTSKVARKSGAFADSMAVVVDASTSNPARAVLTGTTSHARVLPRVSALLPQTTGAGSDTLRAAIIADLEEIDPAADAYQARCHISTISRAVKEAKAK